jgi:hypothetical protein
MIQIGGGHARRIEQLYEKLSMVFDWKTKVKCCRNQVVFCNKQDEHRVVTRNKTRLIEKGYSQVEGLDFD